MAYKWAADTFDPFGFFHDSIWMPGGSEGRSMWDGKSPEQALAARKGNNGMPFYEPPPFIGGSFYRSGEKLADVQKSGNNIDVTYNETPEQKNQRLFRQGSIYNSEKTVGNPYPEQMKRWSDIANYRKDRALDAYDEANTPTYEKFITNSYDKFGGLNNTQAALGFNEIDKSRNKYKQQLASDYDYNIEALGQQEDDRLMQLAQFLQGGQNYEDSLMNNYLSQAFSGSQLGNTQALNASGLQNQMNQLNLYNDQLGQQQSNDQIKALLSAGALASMFIPGGQAVGAGLQAANTGSQLVNQMRPKYQQSY